MTNTVPKPQSPVGNTWHHIPDSTEFPALILDNYIIDGLYKDVKHSTLYRATHKQTGAPVLIKSIHIDRIESWKDLDLFITQSAILKTLDHPGIPKLYDAVDDLAHGSFHLVQQYIDAPCLKSVLEEKGRLPVDLCLDIALQLCDIVEALAAFSPPVVHRDIKPSNILLDADNKVHLIDFDLATARHKQNRGSTVAGTVGYMPAEQYLGKAGTAADIYAIFATVLHLLTGTDPSKMDTEDFRLQFEPHLPPGTDPNLVRLLSDILQPLEEQRLTSLGTIRTRIEAILGKDAPDIVPSGPILDLDDLNIPIRAKSKINPELLNLPPVPRPYRKTPLYGGQDVLGNTITIRVLVVFHLALSFAALLITKSIIPFFIIMPLPLLVFWFHKRMTWKVDRLYDAFCNWQQNTAVISNIEKTQSSISTELISKEKKATYHIRYSHKVGNRIYDVEQDINTLLLPKFNARYGLVETFQQHAGKIELKVGDEVSIIYNPKKPGKALIFPGPVRTYLEHPALLR